MEDLTKDLQVTKERQRQVKELCNLILDWAGHTLDEEPHNKDKILKLLKEYKLLASLENTKNYLEQLKTEEQTIIGNYAELEAKRKSCQDIIHIYERMATTNIQLISEDYDEVLDLNMSKVLVDFNMNDRSGSKSDQALIDISEGTRTIKIDSKAYILEKPEDRSIVQKIVLEKIKSKKKESGNGNTLTKGNRLYGL
jgi:hypothetical protein